MTAEYTIHYSGKALLHMFREELDTAHVRRIIDEGKTIQEFIHLGIPHQVIVHAIDGRYISVSCVRLESDVIVEAVCMTGRSVNCEVHL